jgi:hypothetical protein
MLAMEKIQKLNAKEFLFLGMAFEDMEPILLNF